MKKIITLCLALTCLLFIANAQTNGDYRSFATGNWTSGSTWERFDGITWVATGAPTSSDGIITIRSPHTVAANFPVSGDQVIIEAGGILVITSTFTLNDGPGDDITVNGSLNFNSGTLDGAGNISISNVGNFLLTTGDVKTTASMKIIKQ